MESPVVIRTEQPGDRAAVRKVNEAAFGQPDEADLVERLREEGVVLLSLVAEFDSEIVGHVLFSRMTVEGDHGSLPAVSLAPVAVLPEFQRGGIGSDMIRAGLKMLQECGEKIVIVLGEPDYYARFGFAPERARDIDSPFPSEYFMALELNAGAGERLRGTAKYPAAFGL